MKYEQLDIFQYLQSKRKFNIGDWVGKDALGEQLTFGEIIKEVGNLIVIDQSTSSREWYKVILVEEIVTIEDNQRRLVYYDGKKQRGLVNEMYFDESIAYQSKAWKLKI